MEEIVGHTALSFLSPIKRESEYTTIVIVAAADGGAVNTPHRQ